MRTNYGETRMKGINRNKQVVRGGEGISEVHEGFGCYDQAHIACCDIVRFGS